MDVRTADLTPRDCYRMLCAAVVPRPVAWVSTVDGSGRPNLAPFSFFNAVTTDPPIVMIGVGKSRTGIKDTARNLLETKECVVHIAPRRLAAAMVTTSLEAPHGVDEFDVASLAKVPSVDVRAPRIEGCPFAMECVLDRHIEVGNGPSDMFLLRVVHFHVSDDVLRDGIPDASLLDAVGRLGGDEYCGSTDIFRVGRPARYGA